VSDIIYTEVGSSWCGCDGPDRWCDVCKGRLPTGAAHKEACRVITEAAFKRKNEDRAEILHLYNLLDRTQKEARRDLELCQAEIERLAQLAHNEREAATLVARRFDENVARMKSKLVAADEVVELARKAVASRKDALQHGRASQAECDLAKALAKGGAT